VSNIEAELGVKLVDRANKNNELSLTAEGRVLIEDILRINICYQHLMELKQQLKKDSYYNALRIGSQAKFGTRIEEIILGNFMAQHPQITIEQIKMNLKDLLNFLQTGKLDAVFLNVAEHIQIEDVLLEIPEKENIESIFLAEEKSLFLGISDTYLPEITDEAPFAKFKDFNFAFSFPLLKDGFSDKMILSFEQHARKSGFIIKNTYYGANDPTILKLVTKMPIAIVTTNIPARMDGVKFIRISDWESYTRIYFLFQKNSKKSALENLKQNALEFLNQKSFNSES
ncbi:MAG: hypothetical protein LBN36_08820, partial [Clostridiales Family XIII bacterium]|nr:hypothetical protein [Clostridiales Family XIII bacterium]